MQSSSRPLYYAWGLILIASVFDYGFEDVRCVNRQAIECSGADFTNIGAAIIGLLLLVSNWANLKGDGNWGPRAAAAACIGLLLTAFDGVGCVCR